MRKCLTCGRMLVFTEPQEIIRANLAGQAELFRASPNPLAGHALSFIVVIADAKVFFKVFLGVRQIVLRLGSQHESQCPKTPASFCVMITQNEPERLVHSRA